MRVFLSVAGPDRSKVEAVALALRGQGLDVFLDEQSLAPGADYNRRIRAEIMAADLAVFFISPRSLEPDRYTLTELEIMKDRWKHPGGRVLPVMLHPVPYDKIPVYLQAVKVATPSGNLAAYVCHHVVKMAESLQRTGGGKKPLPGPGTADSLGKAAIAASAFALLTGLVCLVINTEVLRSEGLGLSDHVLVFFRASLLAVLLSLGALFLHIRELNHHVGLFVASLAAMATQYLLCMSANLCLAGNSSVELAVGSSLAFAVVAATISPSFRNPVAVFGLVFAGLLAGVVRLKYQTELQDFIWEAATVGAAMFVVSLVQNSSRGRAGVSMPHSDGSARRVG